MRRRTFLTTVGTVSGGLGLAWLAGCTSAADGTGSGNGDEGPASPGTTPRVLPTPSFPPSTGPIATGLQVDGAALLVWFGDGTGTGDMNSAWYDPGTGGVVSGPVAMAAWPAARADYGFQRVVAAAARNGRVTLYGWLLGPAAQVRLAWRGARLTGTLLSWPADPGRQAFWLHAGDWAPLAAAPRPSGGPSSAASPVSYQAALEAVNANGATMFGLSLSPPG
jgi:hypothetical protein